MEIIKLSPRLKTVAGFIPHGSRVVDVGTDHGYIPVWLRMTGHCETIIASDINQGPLDAARASALRYEAYGIDFRLCPGLQGIHSDEADTVVIAGMSGETISGILEEAHWDFSGKRLILQPMTKRLDLLVWLYQHGLYVSEETYVLDHGRDYLVICVLSSEKPLPRPAYLAAGFSDTPYARKLKRQLERAIEGLKMAENPNLNEIKKNTVLLEDMVDAYGWSDSKKPV